MVRFASVLVLIFTIGCGATATNLSHYANIDKGVIAGNFDQAINELKNREGYNEKDKVLYYLDLGMIYHYAGKYEQSNQALEKAEIYIDELYTKSVSKAALSYLLNDNALDYAGEDYEDIYINLIKAFNYLKLGMVDDVFVEINRLNHKLAVLEDKNAKLDRAYNQSKDSKVKISSVSNKFYNDALGRYVSMRLYQWLGKWDDAAIDKKKIDKAFALQSSIYDFPQPRLSLSREQQDKVAVSMLSLAGQGPLKEAKTLYINTQPGMVILATSKTGGSGQFDLQGLNTFAYPGLQGGYNFKFQLPTLVARASQVHRVEVLVADTTGQQVARADLELMEAFDNVVRSVFELGYRRMVVKSVTRAIVKGVAGEAAKKVAKDQLGDDNIFSLLGGLALDIGINATENADLRAARYLPSKGYIADVYLLPGVYSWRVNYYDKSGKLLKVDDLGRKEVGYDKLNFYQSYCIK